MSQELQTLQNKDKDARTKKEILKLKRSFKDLDKKTLDTVSSLINNAAFMAVTLNDLQETINTEGTVTEYQNGENQWGTKKSPEVEIYNTMIKNHVSIMKTLTDLIPKKDKSEDDGFDSFVSGRDD